VLLNIIYWVYLLTNINTSGCKNYEFHNDEIGNRFLVRADIFPLLKAQRQLWRSTHNPTQWDSFLGHVTSGAYSRPNLRMYGSIQRPELVVTWIFWDEGNQMFLLFCLPLYFSPTDFGLYQLRQSALFLANFTTKLQLPQQFKVA
jgi:hypothetical protein